MAEWHYHYAGVQVASQLALPEWSSFAVTPINQAADVSIWHDAPITNTACISPALTVDGQGLLWQLPKIGRYLIAGGREIALTPCHNAAVGDLRLFLLGSAWGALSYQRGWFPLHASVVQVAERAVAFCAPAGHGKSSLAAWLIKQGYQLVSDDLCRLDVARNEPPQLWPSPPRLKLWRDALAALDWQAQPLIRDQFRVDKFHLLDPSHGSRPVGPPPKLPLAAIYLLAWGELAIQPLTGLAAVRAVLAAATYRPEFMTALGQTATYWQQAIDLVGQVPIFRLQRPREWAAMPAVGEQLIEHMRSYHKE